MLDSLSRLRDGTSKRISSYDVTGGNADCWTIQGGETRQLAHIKGPGCIRHLWVTVAADDEWYLRSTLLRAYWDGEKSPSIDSPLGDFFGVGHGVVSSYSCAVLSMSANPGQHRHAAMNCYFPMPFSERARFEIVNESDQKIGSFYFYLDYELLPSPPATFSPPPSVAQVPGCTGDSELVGAFGGPGERGDRVRRRRRRARTRGEERRRAAERRRRGFAPSSADDPSPAPAAAAADAPRRCRWVPSERYL